MRRRRGWRLVTGMVVAAALTACGGEPVAVRAADTVGNAGVAQVHRSATCECCEGHERHLADGGLTVETVVHDDMVAVKDGLGVPQAVRSCHTTLVEGYVVEGHVPQEAIDALLRTRPAVDGIALPGMPPGSPGMAGDGVNPLEVVSFTGGEVDAFLTVPPAATSR